MSAWSAAINITNSAFVGCSSGTSGGAVYCSDSACRLWNNTFTSNSAPTGTFVYASGGGSTAVADTTFREGTGERYFIYASVDDDVTLSNLVFTDGVLSGGTSIYARAGTNIAVENITSIGNIGGCGVFATDNSVGMANTVAGVYSEGNTECSGGIVNSISLGTCTVSDVVAADCSGPNVGLQAGGSLGVTTFTNISIVGGPAMVVGARCVGTTCTMDNVYVSGGGGTVDSGMFASVGSTTSLTANSMVIEDSVGPCVATESSGSVEFRNSVFTRCR